MDNWKNVVTGGVAGEALKCYRRLIGPHTFTSRVGLFDISVRRTAAGGGVVTVCVRRCPPGRTRAEYAVVQRRFAPGASDKVIYNAAGRSAHEATDALFLKMQRAITLDYCEARDIPAAAADAACERADLAYGVYNTMSLTQCHAARLFAQAYPPKTGAQL